MSVLPAVWLLVIGYALIYIGYRNQSGKPTSFKDAFFGGSSTPAPQNPIQAKGSSSGFAPGASAGQGGGGGGGGSW